MGATPTKHIPEKKLLPPPPIYLMRPSPKDATAITDAQQGPDFLADRILNLDAEEKGDDKEEKKEVDEEREKALASQKEELARLAELPEEDFGMEWDVIYEGDELPLFKNEEEGVIYEENDLDETGGAKFQIVADVEYVEAYPGQVFPRTVFGRMEEEHYQDPYLHQHWDHQNEDQWAQANSKSGIQNDLNDIETGNYIDHWENKDFHTEVNIPDQDLKLKDEEFYQFQEQHSDDVFPPDKVIDVATLNHPDHANRFQSLKDEQGENRISYPLYDDIVTYPSADMMQAAPYQGNLLGADSMQVVLVQSVDLERVESDNIGLEQEGEMENIAFSREFLAGARRNGGDYPTQWSSREIYPHPADSRDSEENANTELNLSQVGQTSEKTKADVDEVRTYDKTSSQEKVMPAEDERGHLQGKDFVYKNKLKPSQKNTFPSSDQRQIVEMSDVKRKSNDPEQPRHHVGNQAAFREIETAASGAESIEAAIEESIDTISAVQEKTDNPISEIRNSIGYGRSSATSADEFRIENLPSPLQLTDVNSDFQILPPVQTLLMRTVTSIEDPAKNNLDTGASFEVVEPRIESSRDGLRDSHLTEEEKSDQSSAAKNKKMQTAQPTDHNDDEGLKAVGSENPSEVKNLSLRENSEGGSWRLGEGEKKHLTSEMLKSQKDKEVNAEMKTGDKKESSGEEKEQPSEKTNVEDEVFLLPAGHGLFLKMKLRHSKKPLLSFFSHDV